MSRIRLSEQAKVDLRAIWDYIGIERGYPDAAANQVEAIYDKLTLLSRNPLLGELREDLLPGLRIFSAGNYVIFYHPMADGIEVLGVIHGARDFEAMFRSGER